MNRYYIDNWLHVAPSAGTYFLQVSGASGLDYQATVVTGGVFDAEPNDSFAAAQPLGAGFKALRYQQPFG